MATAEGKAGEDDYSGVPASVILAGGETLRTLTVTTAGDKSTTTARVRLAFGTLPDRVTEVAPATAIVSIDDDDTGGVAVSATSV